MANPEKLCCTAILICDQVYWDGQTRKAVLAGTFNTIQAGKVPCQHPRMAIFFSVTNARGRYDLSVSIEHEATGQTIMELRGPLSGKDPLAIMDRDIVVNGLVFPAYGKYWVIVKADGEILQQRPLYVMPPVDARGQEAESSDAN